MEMNVNHYVNNTNVIADVRFKIENEIDALKRTKNHPAAEFAQDVQSIIDMMLGTAAIRCRNADTDTMSIQKILGQYVTSIQTILRGGILTPLTGVEEEWEDIKLDPDDSKELLIPFRGKTYTINYKSVQVNKRFRNIYRYNKDNKYAHRIDMIALRETTNRNLIRTTDISLRFIKFPYTLDYVNVNVDVNDEGEIINYHGTTRDGLNDQIAFRSAAGDVILAPRIPFYLLKREGIDYQAEFEALSKNSGN